MNKTNAKKIAETITNEQLAVMFDNAKRGITDWTQISAVNKGLTKGTAWNILAKDFDVDKPYSQLAKKNMIWEFGDFLPDDLKPKKKEKIMGIIPVHQDPEF